MNMKKVSRHVEIVNGILIGIIMMVGLLAVSQQMGRFLMSNQGQQSWYFIASRLGSIGFVGLALSFSWFHSNWRTNRLRSGSSSIGIILFSLLVLWLSWRLPASTTRLFIFTLTTLWFLSVAIWILNRDGLVLIISSMALVALTILGPECVQQPYWGDHRTFQHLFSKNSPYTGPGGRLRPSIDLMVSSGRRYMGNNYRLVTNSDGFRNMEEVSKSPPDGRLRILSLGDSFSNGYGVSQDSFFGPLIEKELELYGYKAQVLNAEVSDPAYALYYLKKHGLEYRPSIVIYGLSGNDIMQTYQWTSQGGVFYFDDSGNYKPHPISQPSRNLIEEWANYAYPHQGQPLSILEHLSIDLFQLRTFRFFRRLYLPSDRKRMEQGEMQRSLAHHHQMRDGRIRLVDFYPIIGFMYKKEIPPVAQMYLTFGRVLNEMKNISNHQGIRFLLIIYPMRYQVQPQDWRAMKERWNLNDKDFDLTLYNRKITQHCEANSISCLDLTEAFRNACTRENLFFPFDDHFNEKGQKLAAKTAAEFLADRPSLIGRLPSNIEKIN